jgi:hypothetical protein
MRVTIQSSTKNGAPDTRNQPGTMEAGSRVLSRTQARIMPGKSESTAGISVQ